MPYSFVAMNADGTASTLDNVGEVITSLFGWMSEVVQTITADGNEIMLASIGIFLLGAAIGLASRLIGR